MLSLLKKEKSKPIFVIDYPKIVITPDMHTLIDALKELAVEYTTVTDGYITFEGRAFGCDVPLMFGIHFHSQRIGCIEIFRPIAYYLSDCYDINESFSQLSDILRKQFGKPFVITDASTEGQPHEQWHTSNYIVNYYIIDRFGLEEHLHINFYK